MAVKIADILNEDEHDPADEKFSDEFLRALDDYTEGGSDSLNTFLRTGEGGDVVSKTRRGDSINIRNVVDVFDREMPVLEYSYSVYRGFYLESWADLRPETDFRNRETIKFGGYVSTSDEVSEIPETLGWRDGQYLHNKPGIYVMFHIETKAGVRGADIMDFYLYQDYGYGFSGTEFELILNRDAEFAVIDKEKQAENPYSDNPKSEYWEVSLLQVK